MAKRITRPPRNNISALPAPLRKIACRLLAEGERSPSRVEAVLRERGAPTSARIRSTSMKTFMRTGQYVAYKARHAHLERLQDFIAWFREQPGWRMTISDDNQCAVTDADGRTLLVAPSLEALLNQIP